MVIMLREGRHLVAYEPSRFSAVVSPLPYRLFVLNKSVYSRPRLACLFIAVVAV